jgi:hypothetical protein
MCEAMKGDPYVELTTAQVVAEIGKIEPSDDGYIALHRVPQLDVVSFLDLIDSTRFSVVPSTDGRVSTVRERPSAGDDHSHQSGYFGLHTDGLALPQVPSYGILTESSLSFLGLGLPPGTPSWGQLLQQGRDAMTSAPHSLVIPSTILVGSVIGFHFMGDGLREAWDPQRRQKAGGRSWILGDS